MREGPTITLPARQLFAVPPAGPVRILCTAGCLWLTLDGDLRDVVLNPGDGFEAGERRVLIYAFERSAFTLLAPVQGTMRRTPQPAAADHRMRMALRDVRQCPTWPGAGR